jgi:hypothetical protein
VKKIRFKVPELNDLPPERAEAVLRRCLDGEEYAHRSRKIWWVCILLVVAGVLTTANVFDWNDITGGNSVWIGLIGVGTVVFFTACMVLAQMWLRVRLVRKLVRKEIADA